MKQFKLHTGSLVDLCEDDVDIKTFIQGKVNSPGREDKDDPFFICDLGDIVKKWKRFHQWLPRVEPFYAVKCNPDPTVMKLLANLGANFDCASKAEIKLILDLGVGPERIIFANPCKQTSFIKYARAHQVKMMTFDNQPELHKIKQYHPDAELVLRIKVDDSKSLCKFGIKFGACPSKAKELLEVAKKLNLNVIGVSFHVGSGCYDASLFYEAVKSARTVFDQAADLGFKFHLLDVGGGFPGADGPTISFEESARELNLGFDEFFPVDSNVRIIAEPGRYFVASAFTSVCNITSVREVYAEGTNNTEIDGFMYYLNDGVYGSFNCILFDHHNPTPYALFGNEKTDAMYHCSVWGPTCDSMDCITKEANMPKLCIGDWVRFDNMGAYTLAAGSKFNGFKQPVIMYMCRRNFLNIIAEELVETDIKNVPQKSISQLVNGVKAIEVN